MFDNGLSPGENPGYGCKRDFNAEAERLNKRLVSNKEMLVATKKFMKSGDFGEINRDDNRVLYALLGALSIRIEQQEQNLDILLAQIEKENANPASS